MKNPTCWFLFFVIMSLEQLVAVTPNSLFSDHMVLQQNVGLPIWGTGRNGEHIRVELNGQVAHTQVDNHRWRVVLKPMKAGGPFVLTIAGDSIIKKNDVYLGEVWVCSGQSNMGRRMAPHPILKPLVNYEKERDGANHPLIRQFEVAYGLSDTLVEEANGRWTVCSPATVHVFSAVGYFFARDLQKERQVPIGLIFSSVGGTEARFWTSRKGLENHPMFAPMVESYDNESENYAARLALFQSNKDAIFAQFRADSMRAKMERHSVPRRPAPPQNPKERRRVSCYFNAMIAPIIRFPIKGVLWYQGESDRDDPNTYHELFPTLISDWRTNWGLGDFPFLFVQLAPFKKNTPELREAQLATLKRVKNTAMVVTTDCGDENDVHPPYKQPVGYRLSLAARALAYHEKVAYSGPIYKSFKPMGSIIELSFTHVYDGLRYSGDSLEGFTIAGADHHFVPAKAQIVGDKIWVQSNLVQFPTSVRYAWANVSTGNLYNSANLPASPFRTSTFPDNISNNGPLKVE